MAGPGMLLRLTSVVTAVVTLVVFSAASHADAKRAPDKTVALMSAQVGGDADPALRTQLQEAVRRGLDSAGYGLVDRDQLRKNLDDQALMDCMSDTCLAQISDAVGAKHFVRAEVEASGASYKLEFELLDLSGASVRKLSESCAVCTIIELTDLIAKVAESLMTTREQKPTSVIIVTQPQGAALQIDGKDLGQAPFTGELAPGKHRLRAQLAGHAEVDQELEVNVGDEQQRFEIILASVSSSSEGNGPARRYRWMKYAAGGSAIGVLITGGYLLSLHHDGKCDTPMTECEDRYNTLTGGLATLGLGVALGAASGWMFLRDSRDSDSSRERRTITTMTTIVPTRGGAYANFRLRF